MGNSNLNYVKLKWVKRVYGSATQIWLKMSVENVWWEELNNSFQILRFRRGGEMWATFLCVCRKYWEKREKINIQAALSHATQSIL